MYTVTKHSNMQSSLPLERISSQLTKIANNRGTQEYSTAEHYISNNSITTDSKTLPTGLGCGCGRFEPHPLCRKNPNIDFCFKVNLRLCPGNQP